MENQQTTLSHSGAHIHPDVRYARKEHPRIQGGIV